MEGVGMEVTTVVGLVLGPALWNIYHDDVFRLDFPERVKTFPLADDLEIVFGADD